MKNQEAIKDKRPRVVPRRDFLKYAGSAVFVIGGKAYSSADGSFITHVIFAEGKRGAPVSEGYLLVDTKKCQGWVLQNSFQKWPDDLTIESCRQCVDPACVEACPEGALEADPEHGNVRMVDKAKCIGC